jgi:hypothetical protein
MYGMQTTQIQGKYSAYHINALNVRSKPALKCDRQRPCSSCKKRKSSRACLYNDQDEDNNMYISIVLTMYDTSLIQLEITVTPFLNLAR